jgi:5'-deoxynucleotidase YfbR-like HD superfamily hydrolase
MNKMNELNELIHVIHAFTSVRRYSNKTLIKDENIAEHSSLVGIICTYLYDNLESVSQNAINLDKLLAHCIYHDMDEIFTGDILNPVKYFTPEIKSGVDEYANKAISKFSEVSGISSIMRYTDKSNLNIDKQFLLKLSDIISVFIKFRIENQLGNRMLNIDYKNVKSAIINHHNKYLDVSSVSKSTNLNNITKLIIDQCIKLDNKDPSLTNIMSRVITH